MVAHRRDQTVTFMPKPLYGEAGNGMHFHQHLFKNKQNVFYDENGYGHLAIRRCTIIGWPVVSRRGGAGLYESLDELISTPGAGF